MFTYRTWIELNKKALWHNIDKVRSLCGSTKIGVVLKGNAYGHGMSEIAAALNDYCCVDWLCVAGTDEALQLRNQGVTKPLLAMSYCDSDPCQVIAADIAVVLCDLDLAQALNQAALQLEKLARVHLKIDTNMCRLGITPAQVTSFLQNLTQYKGISIEGIFTHLSDVNNSDSTFTFRQLELFEEAVFLAKNCLGDQLQYAHALACGALMFEKKYDMVRLGTNVYGFWKLPTQQQRFLAINPHITLQPVLTWKTRIIQIKDIPAGSYVGYNCSFYTDTPRKLAVVPVGYVDGYPRGLSNKGKMVVRGVVVSVVGIVSMNLTMIDVTDVFDVAKGDEVVVMGGSCAGVAIVDVAQMLGTVSNEISTRLNPQIRRIIIE